MGWGDAAAKAAAKAVAALEAVAEIKAIVAQVQKSFESSEVRLQQRFDALEGRIRELERENARLNGAIQSGYGEALKTVLNDRVKSGASPLTEATMPPALKAPEEK